MCKQCHQILICSPNYQNKQVSGEDWKKDFSHDYSVVGLIYEIL